MSSQQADLKLFHSLMIICDSSHISLPIWELEWADVSGLVQPWLQLFTTSEKQATSISFNDLFAENVSLSFITRNITVNLTPLESMDLSYLLDKFAVQLDRHVNGYVRNMAIYNVSLLTTISPSSCLFFAQIQLRVSLGESSPQAKATTNHVVSFSADAKRYSLNGFLCLTYFV